MMNEKTSLVFFGNERIASGLNTDTPLLKSLVAAGYFIEAIIVNQEDSSSGNSRQLEIETIAAEHTIPMFAPKSSNELISLCESLTSKVAVLVAYGRIVPKQVLGQFEIGIINIHPSLLPKHRGSTPIESTILSGESKTGVSIMKLVEKMDAGPLYAQHELLINKDETKEVLANLLLDSASKLLISILPSIISGELQPIPQDDKLATYDKRIIKKDGVLDWSLPASVLERQIRAYTKWPKSSARLGGIDVTILEATVIDTEGKSGELFLVDKQLSVYCGEQALMLQVLQPAGKKQMSSEAFLAGYKNRLELK